MEAVVRRTSCDRGLEHSVRSSMRRLTSTFGQEPLRELQQFDRENRMLASEVCRQDRGLARTFFQTSEVQVERGSSLGTATVEGGLARAASSRISTIREARLRQA